MGKDGEEGCGSTLLSQRHPVPGRSGRDAGNRPWTETSPGELSEAHGHRPVLFTEGLDTDPEAGDGQESPGSF